VEQLTHSAYRIVDYLEKNEAARKIRERDNNTEQEVENYLPCTSSIAKFNNIFPLPTRLFDKWKQGRRIYLKNTAPKSIRDKPTRESPTHVKVLESLLAAKLIEPTKRCQYNAQFFTAPKPGEKSAASFRLFIDDTAHTTTKIHPPKSVLTGQQTHMAEEEILYKIRYKAVLFNIPLHQGSKNLTTFNYKGKFYRFNVLPFGISLAPFVAQMFCNAIVGKIRLSAKMAWGHIDDILVCDRSKKKLVFRIKKWFQKAGWHLNIEKSILKPSKSIEYLGAKWSKKTSDQVTRNL
jgi:hypothetical protein